MTAPVPRQTGRDDAPRRLMTLDEYFAFEEDNPVRHEYVAGQVFAMSPGVLLPHSQISGNIFAHLWIARRGGSCRVHQSDVKARIGDIVYYPDVMVACGPKPDNPRYEEAPCFVAEVLSRSTRAIDLRDKAPNYRRLASLQLLLLVDQFARRVDRFWRDEAGAWQMEVIIGQGEIPVPCPATADGPLVLTLDDIYEGLTFPTKTRRVREELPAWLADDADAYDPDDDPAELDA